MHLVTKQHNRKVIDQQEGGSDFGVGRRAHQPRRFKGCEAREHRLEKAPKERLGGLAAVDEEASQVRGEQRISFELAGERCRQGRARPPTGSGREFGDEGVDEGDCPVVDRLPQSLLRSVVVHDQRG